MFAAVDVHKPPSGTARAGLVLASDAAFSIVAKKAVFIKHVDLCQPRRVLPPRAAATASGLRERLWPEPADRRRLRLNARPGLSAYAHAEAVDAIPVLRGDATRSLYITSVGIPPTDPAELVLRVTCKFTACPTRSAG